LVRGQSALVLALATVTAMEDSVKALALTAVVILGLQAAPAMARQDALAQACVADVNALCKGVEPGEGRVARCLQERFSETSPECRRGLVKAALVTEACRADRRAICAGIPPGGGRVTACLSANLSRLGDTCRDALAMQASPDGQPRAVATTLDIGTLTCGQTMQSQLGRAALITAWLSGYRHGKAGSDMIDAGRLEGALNRVGAYCAVRPNAPLIDAVEATSR
jgi:hypothetical protein